MKYFAIGIWDDNTEYGLRLAEYLMHCTEYQIQIMTFSELRQLVKWIRKHSLDVLITGGENALEEIRHMYYEDVFSDQKEEVQDLVSAVIECLQLKPEAVYPCRLRQRKHNSASPARDRELYFRCVFCRYLPHRNLLGGGKPGGNELLRGAEGQLINLCFHGFDPYLLSFREPPRHFPTRFCGFCGTRSESFRNNS